MSLRAKIILGFLVGLLFLSVTGYLTYKRITESLALERSERQPQAILNLSEILLTQIRDVQDGAFGYILTGDTTYRDWYSATVGQVGLTMKQLYTIPNRSGELNRNLALLDTLLDKKMEEMNVSIRLRQEKNLIKPASDFMRKNKSRLVADSIRAVVYRIRNNQRDSIEKQIQESQNTATMPLLVALGAGAAALVIMLVMALVGATSVTATLRTLTQFAEQLALGDVTQRTPLPTSIDLKPLALSLNTVATNLQGVQHTAKSSYNLMLESLNATPHGFAVLKALRSAGLSTANKIMDFEWQISNAAAARIIGSTPNALYGKRLLNAFPNHKTNGIFEQYSRVVESGISAEIEERHGNQRYAVTASKFSDGIVLAYTPVK